MNGKSIFEPRRFELQGSHLYYLPKKLADELRVEMPVFLVGLRGTGKTTLLHSLSWQQRTTNKAYRDQLIEQFADPFFDHIIGVYTKLPESKIADIGRWLDNQEKSFPRIFSLYFDLLVVELVLDSVASLSAQGILTGSADLERETVSQIISTVWDSECWRQYSSRFAPTTFKTLGTVYKKVRQELEFFAESSKPADIANDFFRPLQIGALGKEICGHLDRFCNHDTANQAPDREKWSFRVCMDEGEHLSAWQQKVVNSIFRLAKWPLFYIVAYVELPDVTSTFLEGLTLSVADRMLIELTTQSDTDFKEYVEGVVNVRIRNEVSSNACTFAVDRVFGKLQINRILDSILSESVSPKAIELRTNAVELKKSDEEFPPYLELFYEQLAVPTENSDTEPWRKRRESSAGFRKKFVATYLSLCKQLNSEVRYAFSEMLMQISDKCVRDFLSQVHEIFIGSGGDLENFLTKTCDWKIQDRGIRRASIAKRKSFGSMLCVTGADALVDGLGQVTAFLQSSPGRNFSSPELGRFKIARMPETQIDSTEKYLEDVLFDAVLSGFLRFSDNASSSRETWTVQLHASLSPFYGFSYRGAMYECEVARKDLLKLLSATTPDGVKFESKRIATRIGAQFEEMPLFDLMNQDHDK